MNSRKTTSDSLAILLKGMNLGNTREIALETDLRKLCLVQEPRNDTCKNKPPRLVPINYRLHSLFSFRSLHVT